ncbi:hypothetical protein D3C81_2027910 [compost metagenome]
MRYGGVTCIAGHFQRQRQGEAAAQAWFTDHAHMTIHQLRQTLADGQAQSGPGDDMGIAFGLVEGIENVRLILLGNAFAGIRHLPQQP